MYGAFSSLFQYVGSRNISSSKALECSRECCSTCTSFILRYVLLALSVFILRLLFLTLFVTLTGPDATSADVYPIEEGEIPEEPVAFHGMPFATCVFLDLFFF